MITNAIRILSIALGCLLFEPHVFAANVDVRIKFYNIFKEKDGNGVDLYVGYLVSGPKRQFGGTSEVKGGMKAGSGDREKPGDAGTVYLRREKLFSLDVPEGTSALIRLYLIEADSTTPEVRRSFEAAKPPQYSEADRNAGVEVAAKVAGKIFGSTAEDIVRLLSFKNTDDDYGNWDFELRNDDGVIHVRELNKGAGCAVNIHGQNMKPDGQIKDFLGLIYKDAENEVNALLEVVVTK